MNLAIAGVELQSRFFLGTASYPSPSVLRSAIESAGTQVVTVGLRRQLAAGGQGDGGSGAGGAACAARRIDAGSAFRRAVAGCTGASIQRF